MTPASLLFAYMTIGFCAAFPSLGTSYVMVDTLHFSASEVATAMLLCSVPWCVKPLWAYISDSCPVCGYRRRPYVCVFSLIASAFLVATPQYATPETSAGFVAMLVGASFALCFVDIAVDGSVMVLVGAESGVEEGKAQTDSWTARITGTCLAAGWSGYAYQTFGYRSLMIGCAVLPLVLSVVSLDIPDLRAPAGKAKTRAQAQRHQPREVLRTVLGALWQTRFALGAATVVALVPEINTSLFFYMLSTHATPKEMSLVDVAGSMASLVALGVYNAVRPGHKRSFFLGVLLQGVAAAVGALMADDAVPWLLQGACVQQVVSSTGGALTLMPIVTVLGKAAAQTDSEATVYSCSLSILNLAAVVSESIAAAAMQQLHVTRGDVNNVRVFVAVVAAVTFLVSPVAFLFPSRSHEGYHAAGQASEQRVRLIGATGARRQNPFHLGDSDDASDDSDDDASAADGKHTRVHEHKSRTSVPSAVVHPTVMEPV